METKKKEKGKYKRQTDNVTDEIPSAGEAAQDNNRTMAAVEEIPDWPITNHNKSNNEPEIKAVTKSEPGGAQAAKDPRVFG